MSDTHSYTLSDLHCMFLHNYALIALLHCTAMSQHRRFLSSPTTGKTINICYSTNICCSPLFFHSTLSHTHLTLARGTYIFFFRVSFMRCCETSLELQRNFAKLAENLCDSMVQRICNCVGNFSLTIFYCPKINRQRTTTTTATTRRSQRRREDRL